MRHASGTAANVIYLDEWRHRMGRAPARRTQPRRAASSAGHRARQTLKLEAQRRRSRQRTAALVFAFAIAAAGTWMMINQVLAKARVQPCVEHGTQTCGTPGSVRAG